MQLQPDVSRSSPSLEWALSEWNGRRTISCARDGLPKPSSLSGHASGDLAALDKLDLKPDFSSLRGRSDLSVRWGDRFKIKRMLESAGKKKTERGMSVGRDGDKKGRSRSSHGQKILEERGIEPRAFRRIDQINAKRTRYHCATPPPCMIGPSKW